MSQTDLKTIKFLVCGHVDDGKSTLIGRLIYDLGVVPEDQIYAAKNKEGKIDYSMFTDGLEDERRQGITIDVAYRYFRHQGYSYCIADTPGHPQYMKNMAVAAVESNAAIILIDAIAGVRLTTIEYSKIAKFFGVKNFLVAINKMDVVGYDEKIFHQIRQHFLSEFDDQNNECDITFIPVSAIEGDNICYASEKTRWYSGLTIFDYLRNFQKTQSNTSKLFLPIQDVTKDDCGDRWYMGTLQGKSLKVGDTLVVGENRQKVSIIKIFHSGCAVDVVDPKSSIAIKIAENICISRGSVLEDPINPMMHVKNFDADILWVNNSDTEKSDQRLTTVDGIMKLHHVEVQVKIRIDHDIDNAKRVLKNAHVILERPLPIDIYKNIPRAGLFLIIDPVTETIMIVGTVRKLTNSDII